MTDRFIAFMAVTSERCTNSGGAFSLRRLPMQIVSQSLVSVLLDFITLNDVGLLLHFRWFI